MASSPETQMAPTPAAPTPAANGARRLFRLIRALLVDPAYFWYTAGLLLAGETVLTLLIVHKVLYTEIDWVAYMQEVEGFLSGERDYMKLEGDTGPLVYPAGFVHLFSFLHNVTSGGSDIRTAQYLFAALYLATMFVVFCIYRGSPKIPPYVLITLCLSKRLHSIYVLRLFNDCCAMALLYTCILAMHAKKWTLASTLYSLALSIKMNILLFFPAFGVLIYKTTGVLGTALNLFNVVVIQLVLAIPFVTTYPGSYFARAFEFSRTFLYKWTVNWKFLDEETFLSGWFAKLLLACHAFLLAAFVFGRWCRQDNGALAVLSNGLKRNFPGAAVAKNISPDHITTLMLTSNFIGIVCSRTLHFQFYSWYFHGLPFLLWHCTKIWEPLRFLLLLVVEYSWNVYPARPESSGILLFCHLAILWGLWSGDAEGQRTTAVVKQKQV